jgi:H+/Cl- antiporter ClcA
MLRRLLAGLSIASLLVGLIVLVFWWRSYRHVDHFSLGHIESRRSTYVSRDGRVWVTVSDNIAGMITQRSEFYEHWRLALWCLTIPGFWLAITLRRKLRPAARGSDVSKEQREMMRRMRDA